MEFTIKSGNPIKQKSSCLIVAVFEPRRMSPMLEQLNEQSDGYIATILRRGELEGKLGQSLLLHSVANITAERILLIGCGKEREIDENTYKTIIGSMLNACSDKGILEAVTFLTTLKVKGHSLAWNIKFAVQTIEEMLYQYDEFKSEKQALRRELRKLTLMIDSKSMLTKAEEALAQALAIAKGITLTKNLANCPPNVCNPEYLAKTAQDLANQYKNINTTILDQNDLANENMNAYLAVADGSVNQPYLSVLEYKGDGYKPEIKPIVLVGKGMTFDSGGLSIKPAASMDEMKYDMCGAASVLGVMKAIAELNLPLHVIGLAAGCDNMIGSKSYRPGDIIKTKAGLFVEVLNTDAEGRMVLADCLTYVEKYQPSAVIDIATLTGACIVALGDEHSGLLANNQPLASELFNAGNEAFDLAWQLPLTAYASKGLKSNFADLANIGGKGAGAITAAAFLSAFSKKYNWAHLDIAGTAWKSGAEKGATGRPVGLLVQYLLNKASK